VDHIEPKLLLLLYLLSTVDIHWWIRQ